MFFGNAPDTCYYIDRYQHTHTHTPSYINYEAHSEQKQKLQRLICIPFNNFFLWMMAFYGCNSEGSQEMHMLKATQHLPIFAKRTRYSCLDIERKSWSILGEKTWNFISWISRAQFSDSQELIWHMLIEMTTGTFIISVNSLNVQINDTPWFRYVQYFPLSFEGTIVYLRSTFFKIIEPEILKTLTYCGYSKIWTILPT